MPKLTTGPVSRETVPVGEDRGMSVARIGEEQPHIPATVLPGSGLRLNRVILGVGPFGKRPAASDFDDVLSAYVNAGGSTFDVSGDDAGWSASAMGDWLADQRREDVVLTARTGRRRGALSLPGGAGDTSKRQLMVGLDDTLALLGVEHVDLWLVDGLDGVTPLDEVAAAMQWALSSGRTAYVGIARASAWEIVDLAHRLTALGGRLSAAVQTYHLLDRRLETDYAAAASSLGFGLIGAAPLAGGALSGKYRHGTPADSRLTTPRAPEVKRFLDAANRPVIESLVTAADGLGVHPSELALAWALEKGTATAHVIGPRTVPQMKIAARACELLVPREIMAALDEVSEHAM